MTEKKEHVTEAMTQRRGRPHVPAQMARPNRVVTFVTDQELQSISTRTENMFESGSCFRADDELKKARRYLVNRTSSVGVAVQAGPLPRVAIYW